MLSDQEHTFEQSLKTLFYRDSCPDAASLGGYFANELRSGERLVIAQHLRLCPHCTSELSLYGEGQVHITPQESQLANMISQVRWMLERSDQQPILVRGTTIDTQRIFSDDDIEVRIEIIPASSGYQRLRIFGQITSIGSMHIESTHEVELWDKIQGKHEETVSVTEKFFDFPQVHRGEYLLCLKTPGKDTWLGPLYVNDGG
ncbi:MAG: hypothetical protein AAF702_34790 [Chloroflexota bacterium]